MHFRSANCADAREISELHVAMWRDVYSFIPQIVHDKRDLNIRMRQWRTALFPFELQKNPVGVVISDENIAGFWKLTLNTDRDAPKHITHELHACYLLPSLRGTLAGPTCLSLMLDEVINRNGNAVSLWVFRENPMRKMYRQIGFKPFCHRDRVIADCAIPEIGMVHNEPQLLNEWLRAMIKRHGPILTSESRSHLKARSTRSYLRKRKSQQPIQPHPTQIIA